MSKQKTFIKIPTWNQGEWTYTEFSTQEDFRSFLLTLFKEPGEYNFNEVSNQFDIHAQTFKKKGLYSEAPEGSRDFQVFWDTEKEKCRKGVIYTDGVNFWYLTRELYFWWNFLKIPDKVKKTEEFPEPWDVHYHIALYNILAKLHHKHSAILKKRQIGSSLYHMALMINLLWFEKSQVLKMGASAKDYINMDKGSWGILELYRNFLNQHTGWFRSMNPDKSAAMSWQQRLEVKDNGRASFEGNMSKLTGTSFEKNATAGVGGACHRLGTLICMANGKFKKVEDITIGEYVLGIDNKPKKVERVFSGTNTIYEIKQQVGITYYTTEDHKLYLYSQKVNEHVTVKASLWNTLSADNKLDFLSVCANIPTKPLESVTEVGIEPYAGIQVEDSLYYLHDLTITHNCRFFFHEEAGIAPKMLETYEFMRPALKMGGILTGQFIAAGSVGELTHCGPLKSMILEPNKNDIYGVPTDLISERGTIAHAGLFIPEQWGRPPFIDQYGNSLVKEALADIQRERAMWKYGDEETKQEPLSPALLQLRISQQPINIEEAFAIRKQSLFNSTRIREQLARIDNQDYKLEYIDLERTVENKIVAKPSDRQPIPFPVKETLADKRGCVVIHEHPLPGAHPLRTYIASVDPVAGDKTVTSESLASIYIYKMPIMRTIKHPDGKIESYTEGGKIVAWWTGRYDDLTETNEQLSLVLEYYNAFTTCEYNVGSFVNYMIGKKRTKYLAYKEDMLFDKEADIKQSSTNRYGWYNTPQVWKKMLEYGVNSLNEELLTTYKEDGTVDRIIYGVERIPDTWLLREMQDYQVNDGKNYDRIITYCSLIAFADIRLTTMASLYTESSRTTDDDSKEDKNKLDSFRTFKQGSNYFARMLGMSTDKNPQYSKYKQTRRNPFKNLR